ncbi:hypothetical protein [Azospirillum sp.]|uniref:hypothetical protein n=1 Tax=Azospirillum sp. TaxID=34012 RepID=UPI003D74CC3B
MIYNCFIFFNELDILELQLEETYDYVDKFVIVEATETHMHVPKPLYYADNRSRFQRFADKIIHVVVDDMPAGADSWQMEFFQRNAIARGLADTTAEDTIIIADVDEIIRRECLRDLRNDPRLLVGMRLQFSYFRLNYVNVAGPEQHMVWAIAAKQPVVAQTSPQKIRDSRFGIHAKAASGAFDGQVGAIDNAGWHFSYIGNTAHVVNKLRNFSHQEFNVDSFLQSIDVDDLIRRGADLFDRSGYRWELWPVDERFPVTLRQNIDRYQTHIGKVGGGPV